MQIDKYCKAEILLFIILIKISTKSEDFINFL
jgi:hypothetical protein